MASWYVDKGLDVLVDEIKKRFPGIVVGTIGDSAHAGTTSDHNPSTAAHDRGAVDAADFMIGPNFTYANAMWLVNTLVRFKDRRIGYIIFDGRIISSTVSAWNWRKYSGTDPHTNHVHLSVNDLHEGDTTLWQLEESTLADDPRTWTNPTVLAVNFFFSEANRAALGKATSDSVNDKNARNAFAYLNNIHDKAGEEVPTNE